MLCFHHTVTAHTWIRVSLPSSVDSCRPLPSPCTSPDSLFSRQPLPWTILLKCELDNFRLLPAGQPATARHLAQSRKPVTFAYVALCPSYLSVLDPHLPVLSLSPTPTSHLCSSLSAFGPFYLSERSNIFCAPLPLLGPSPCRYWRAPSLPSLSTSFWWHLLNNPYPDYGI